MIELFHVTKRYPGAERPALDDLNLSIGRGEMCLVLGPSGAGKSTLLRLLFCAETASSGQVLLNGKNLARLKPTQVPEFRRSLGVVFQDFKLLSDMTALENVSMTLEVRGISRRQAQTRARKILGEVGLAHRVHHLAVHLSGGEQQRVAIARALVADPTVLICDEPTGNLDPGRSRDILELLFRAHARGTTVIIATHDPDLLARHHDRALVLNDGRLVKGVPWS